MDNNTKAVAKIGQDIASATKTAVTTYSDKAVNGARAFADFNTGTLAALTEANQILVAGTQELLRDVAQSGQAAFAETLSGFRPLASLKTVKEGMERQASLIRASAGRLLSESHRLAQASLALTERA